MDTYPFDIHSLIKICRENDVTSVSLFGSMARGEATEKSDIDLLVKFGKRKNLLSVVKLERQLAMALGRKVDLITEGALSPYIRDDIINDLETFYAA
ncbi:MAG: nucleotidyltransferase family protein [Desulforhopalus sp.]